MKHNYIRSCRCALRQSINDTERSHYELSVSANLCASCMTMSLLVFSLFPSNSHRQGLKDHCNIRFLALLCPPLYAFTIRMEWLPFLTSFQVMVFLKSLFAKLSRPAPSNSFDTSTYSEFSKTTLLHDFDKLGGSPSLTHLSRKLLMMGNGRKTPYGKRVGIPQPRRFFDDIETESTLDHLEPDPRFGSGFIKVLGVKQLSDDLTSGRTDRNLQSHLKLSSILDWTDTDGDSPEVEYPSDSNSVFLRALKKELNYPSSPYAFECEAKTVDDNPQWKEMSNSSIPMISQSWMYF